MGIVDKYMFGREFKLKIRKWGRGFSDARVIPPELESRMQVSKAGAS